MAVGIQPRCHARQGLKRRAEAAGGSFGPRRKAQLTRDHVKVLQKTPREHPDRSIAFLLLTVTVPE